VRAFLSVSLRDVSLVMGPLAMLTQIPTLAQIPLEAATTAIAPAVAGVAATALAFVAPARPHSARAHDRAAAVTDASGQSVSATGARGGGSGVATKAGGKKTATPGTTPGSKRGGASGTHTTAPGATPTTLGRGPGGTTPTVTTGPHSPTTVPVSSPPTTAPSTTAPTTNHAPHAVNDNPHGKQSPPSYTIAVLANDTDADGNLDPSTLTIVRPPNGSGQSATIVGSAVRITVPSGFKGTVNFRYQVCDTGGACAQAEVNVGFA